MKKIIFSKHSLEQCKERGTNENEVINTINIGVSENVKNGRIMFKANFAFNSLWNGNFYAIKQVAPVIVEEVDKIIVITVYTFYF